MMRYTERIYDNEGVASVIRCQSAVESRTDEDADAGDGERTGEEAPVGELRLAGVTQPRLSVLCDATEENCIDNGEDQEGDNLQNEADQEELRP